MTLLDAHQVAATFDCAWPGCPREARVAGGYCDGGHPSAPPLPPAAGELAHLAGDEHLAEEPAPRPCKIKGCGEPSVARAGLYGALCATHRERARAAAQADRVEREYVRARQLRQALAARRSGEPEASGEAAATKPAQKPRGSTATSPRPTVARTLMQLAEAVERSDAHLVEALVAYAGALEAAVAGVEEALRVRRTPASTGRGRSA